MKAMTFTIGQVAALIEQDRCTIQSWHKFGFKTQDELSQTIVNHHWRRYRFLDVLRLATMNWLIISRFSRNKAAEILNQASAQHFSGEGDSFLILSKNIKKELSGWAFASSRDEEFKVRQRMNAVVTHTINIGVLAQRLLAQLAEEGRQLTDNIFE